METTATGSVSDWLMPLKQGSHEAAGRLFDRYFVQMTGLAKARLGKISRGHLGGDEEDVAQAAFHAFCQAAGHGQIPVLEDREDLWKVLTTITRRQAARFLERQGRLKRGGPAAGYSSGVHDLDDLPGREPDPALRAATVEQLRRYLDALEDDVLTRVAVLKMEGHSIKEIAAQVDFVERSVQRKLNTIRKIWQGGRA